MNLCPRQSYLLNPMFNRDRYRTEAKSKNKSKHKKVSAQIKYISGKMVQEKYETKYKSKTIYLLIGIVEE